MILYLNESITSGISDYHQLSSIPTYTITHSITSNLSKGTRYVVGFSMPVSELGIVFIPAGLWEMNIFVATNGSSDLNKVQLYFAIYGRSADGTEIQISANSGTALISNTSMNQYNLSLNTQYTSISSYTYIVVKLMALVSNNATIITYYEDSTTYSHIHTSFGVLGNTGPIGPTGAKTFVLPHPIRENHYLVHACIEGPEAGVYYRGKVKIEREREIIQLPNYVEHLACDFTIHVTPESDEFVQVRVTPITNNQFTIHSTGPCIANWFVMGKRKGIELEVEPSTDTMVHGIGPYQWI